MIDLDDFKGDSIKVAQYENISLNKTSLADSDRLNKELSELRTTFVCQRNDELFNKLKTETADIHEKMIESNRIFNENK